jgi:hypothetical protein
MPVEKKIQVASARRSLKTDGVVPSPYLQAEVELTDEREQHITEHRDRIAPTLADPDQVSLSTRFSSARVFTRWYNDLRGGKHVVVVVVTASEPDTRHWIITAYITRRLARGEAVWHRS